VKGLPYPWHHGWALALEGLQDGRPCNGVESVFQLNLQQESPRAPVHGVHLGLHPHCRDLAGSPHRKCRLERGKGGGGVPA